MANSGKNRSGLNSIGCLIFVVAALFCSVGFFASDGSDDKAFLFIVGVCSLIGVAVCLPKMQKNDSNSATFEAERQKRIEVNRRKWDIEHKKQEEELAQLIRERDEIRCQARERKKQDRERKVVGRQERMEKQHREVVEKAKRRILQAEQKKKGEATPNDVEKQLQKMQQRERREGIKKQAIRELVDEGLLSDDSEVVIKTFNPTQKRQF